MKVGNVGQAAALGVVAVGAIGFLFLQLKGNGGPANPVQQAAIASPTNRAAVASALPTSVYGDPFFNAAYIGPDDKAKTKEEEDKAKEKDKRPAFRPAVLSGELPYSVVLPNPGVGLQPDNGDGPVDQPTAAPVHKGPSICLQGTVAAGHPIAFLSLDGKGAQEYAVGQQVTETVTVQQILDGAIVLRLSKGSKTLRVGESLQP